MAFCAAIARCRSTVPPCAFLATAALSVLLAAQAELACGRQIVMSMPGMEMPAGSGGVALCPIVLALGLAAAILTAAAVAALAADPNRRLTGRVLVRRYAAFSFPLAASAVLALGSGSVGLMIAVDGSTPSGAAGWLVLAGIVVAVTLATTLTAFAFVRALAALGGRVALILARELALLGRGALVPVFVYRFRGALAAHRLPVLAARRGLRAPPLSAR
jgi:hypothetical protein